MVIVIPNASLVLSTSDITVTANADTKFAIVTASSTVANVTVAGTNAVAQAGTTDVVVTIVNDGLAAEITTGADLSSWITNLPAGLTAVSKATYAAAATSVTITIDGTPTAVLTAAMTIVIPNASLALSTSNITVTTNANAKFEIFDYAPVPLSIVLSGGDGTPVTVTTNVAIPAPGETDTTGSIVWQFAAADMLKLTVVDNGGVSSITLDNNVYTSGTNHIVIFTAPITIVVTTTKAGCTTAVRTFTVTVATP